MAQRHADPDDAAWIRATTRAIARGDRQALGMFYERWFERTYAAARRLTGRDESFCLDVVQETMLRVIRSMKELQGAAELGAWMDRAVHSAAIDLLRRESRRIRREAKRGGHSEQVAADVDDRIEWVLARMAELPAGESTLVALRLGGDQSLESVGAATGLSGHAAQGRIRRTLARLRRWAREDGHD
ncbi:MAG: sigma-70 family RNA polymerase sigma factor [Phycisphaeraceae bacterium]|nr:sigma-70 family RNA polymerase sigma factor [Phycisphaeraceae bacterium]